MKESNKSDRPLENVNWSLLKYNLTTELEFTLNAKKNMWVKRVWVFLCTKYKNMFPANIDQGLNISQNKS